MSILKLLNLRRNEVPRLAHAASIFFLVSVNDGIVKSVAAAVFNIRQGVEHLPLMYTWIAVLFSVSMALLSWLTAKVARQRLLFGLLGVVELVLVCNTGALLLEHQGFTFPLLQRIFYPFLFVSSELARSLVGFQIWIVAGCICYTARAKVLFPLLAASATVGDISGGFVVRLLGNLLESYQLYGLSVVNMAFVIVLMGPLARRYFVRPQEEEKGGASLGENLRFFGRSTYLQLLFVLSIGVFALYTSIHYGFNVVGRVHFSSEGEFTSLFGLFYGCTGIGTLVITTLLLQRLLRWLGTGNVYLWVCIAYVGVSLTLMGVFGGTLALPPVGAVFLFNLLNYLLLDSVVAPTYQVLIKMMPQRHSDGTRMIMEGGFMLLGGLAGAGLTALHARQVLPLNGLFAALLALTAVMVVCGWLLKKSYTQMLIRAVREQDIDVDDESAMASLNRLLARSADMTRDLLVHRDDGVRQMGIEILRRYPGPWVGPVCFPLLDHENPRIRSAALEALSAGSVGDQTLARVLPNLDDREEEVRLSAVRAVERIISGEEEMAAGTPVMPQRDQVIDAVLPRLMGESRRGMPEFLVILERLGHLDSQSLRHALLERMVASDDVDERIAGIQAADRMGTTDVYTTVVQSLDHPHPAVREAAVEYLGKVRSEEGFAGLLGMLGDPDPDVVEATVQALGSTREQEQVSALVERLERCTPREWAPLMAALIVMDDHRLIPALMSSCRRRLVEANRYLVAIARLREYPATPAFELLVDQLKGQIAVVQNATVRLLGFLGDVEVVGDLLERLGEEAGAARENAIELLENFADSELLAHLLPLLEEDAEAQLAQAEEICGPAEKGLEGALQRLLQSPDPWTQMAAAWTAGELRWTHLLEALPDELPSQVRESIEEIERKRREGAMAAVNLPLTTMEKITFLKGSEFFATLPLEELYHIALTMEEESFKPGTMVIEEGTTGDKMYIVVSGQLEVKRDDGQRVAVLGEEQVFGDMALLDDEPRSASVIALEEVHLLSLQRSSLERILRRYASIAFNMMRILSRRLRASMTAA